MYTSAYIDNNGDTLLFCIFFFHVHNSGSLKKQNCQNPLKNFLSFFPLLSLMLSIRMSVGMRRKQSWAQAEEGDESELVSSESSKKKELIQQESGSGCGGLGSLHSLTSSLS